MDFSNSYFVTVFSGHSDKIQRFQKFSFWKCSSEKEGVCGDTVASLQLKLLPALHLAGELPLSGWWFWYLHAVVSFALGERLRAGGSRWRAELADPRTGRIHSVRVHVRIEKYKWNCNLIHQRCVPQGLTQTELLLIPAGQFGLSHHSAKLVRTRECGN